jgi:glycine cleavage system transcriptional repressor
MSLTTTTPRVIVSGVGDDKPGMVAALTEVLMELGGNIEETTMARLAEQFAMIVVVSLPDADLIPELKTRIETLHETSGLLLQLKPLTRVHQAQPDPDGRYFITVSGEDRTGITYQVSRALSQASVNITDLNAHAIEGENGPIYLMMIEVDPPQNMSEATLHQLMEPVRQTLGMEIQIRPVNAFVG